MSRLKKLQTNLDELRSDVLESPPTTISNAQLSDRIIKMMKHNSDNQAYIDLVTFIIDEMDKLQTTQNEVEFKIKGHLDKLIKYNGIDVEELLKVVGAESKWYNPLSWRATEAKFYIAAAIIGWALMTGVSIPGLVDSYITSKLTVKDSNASR